MTSTAGEFAVLDFKAGVTTAIENVIVLPKDWDKKDLLIEVPFTIDTAPIITDVMDFFLGFQPVKCDVSEGLSPATTFLAESMLDSKGEFPPPGAMACLRFIIPAVEVEESDSVRLTLWRSKNDSYSGKFRAVGYRY